MYPTPVNEAEAVVEPFWEPHISPLAKYAVTAAAGSNAYVEQEWCWSSLCWDFCRGDGEMVLRLRRDCDFDLAEYDTMLIQFAAADAVRLSLRARMDGAWVTVVDHAAGANTNEEFSGPIPPGQLQALEIEVASTSPAMSRVSVNWVMVGNRQRLADKLGRPPPFGPDWPHMLASPSPGDIAPGIGLFFGEDELDAIRQRVQDGPYAKAMAGLRQRAKAVLETSPETEIRDDPPPHDRRYNRSRDQGRRSHNGDAVICAFVGLVDRDPELIRMACRCLLAVVHYPHWDWSFMCRFPGSAWNVRCFVEDGLTASCATVLDWAAAGLTPHAKAVVCNEMWRKGLAAIERDFQNQAYIRNMNQGLVFSRGRVLGSLALMHHWQYAGENLDIAARNINEMIDNYVLPDGGTDEGVGYWAYTFSSVLPAMAALARHGGQELADIIPARLHRSAGYILGMLSSCEAPGTFLPIGDAHRGALPLLPLMILAQAGNHRLAPLANRIVAANPDRQAGPFDIVYAVDGLAADDLPPPPFILLPDCGYLASWRPTDRGMVRFQLLGGKVHASHAHDDRGSFILEAFGDILAMDRGMTRYDDPNTGLFKLASWHNLLVPVLPDGSQPRMAKGFPAATVPEGEGDAVRLHAAATTTEAWDGLFKSCRREIDSPTPTEFAIRDLATLPAPGQVEFRLHSPHPMRQEGDAVVVEGPHPRLLVTPRWPVQSIDCAIEGADDHGDPVWRMALRSQVGEHHDLETDLRIE